MSDEGNDQPRTVGGAPHPGRGNGLPAPAWVAVSDVDPRLADPLLEVLRDADVPAYVAPATGSVGYYLERRLPDRPTDRLYVDARLRAQAEQIVNTTMPTLQEALEDENWAAIVATFDTEQPPGDWPDVESSASSVDAAPMPPTYAPPVEPEEDHFVPPDPPPLPPAEPVTKYGWTALLGGLGLLIVPMLFRYEIGNTLILIAIGGIIGGFVTLVMRMKDSGSPDDDPDDGAVV